MSVFAQGPNNSDTYYQNADGKKGSALKTALAGIIKKHKTLSYTPDVWEGIYWRFHYLDQARFGGKYNKWQGGQHASELSRHL